LSLLLFGAWHIFVSCYSYREIVGVKDLMNNTQSRELQERLKIGDVIKVKTTRGTFEDIHIVSVNKKNIGVVKWNNDKLHDYHLIRLEDIETLSIKIPTSIMGFLLQHCCFYCTCSVATEYGNQV